MPATVRRATAADIEVLVSLMTDFYAESGYPLDVHSATSSCLNLLADSSLGVVWMLESGDEPAGYVVLTFGFSMEYGGRDAFVDDLFVCASYRRRGLGRLALETLFDECRRRGVRAVHLEAGRDNTPALELYRRAGFEDHDRRLLTLRLSGDAD